MQEQAHLLGDDTIINEGTISILYCVVLRNLSNVVSELYDLFVSGDDSEIRELEHELAKKERRWKDLTKDICFISMPVHDKMAIESTEYGYEEKGTIHPPNPFIRSACDKNNKKWKRRLEDAAELFISGEDIGKIEDIIEDIGEEIRDDLFKASQEHGVSTDISEVFKRPLAVVGSNFVRLEIPLFV